MKATLQLISGVVRVGPECDAWERPWEYAVTFSAADPHTCTLFALKSDGNFTSAHRRAIIRALRDAGFKHIGWTRVKPDAVRQVTAS